MQNILLSARIKEQCKINKLTVKKLLEKCNMNRNTIYDLENKHSFPSSDKLSRIADYLDCSVDYLLGRTDNPEINKSAPPIKEIKLAAESISADAVVKKKKKLS